MRHEWLVDDKYKKWVAKDCSGDQKFPRFKVCTVVSTDCGKIRNL